MSKANAIGTGAIVITANADQLQNGLQQAGQKVNQWAGSVQAKAAQSAASGVAGNGGGIMGMILGGAKAHPAALAITAGLALAAVGVNEVVDSVKELAAVGKQAETLGIAPERFMGLGAAAKKAGIEQDQFAATLGKLSARVSLAASGNDEFARTFNMLGLNAEQLRGMSIDQQFLAVGDAINKLPAAGDKAAMAMKLFEEGGLKLLPVFAKGSAGLEEFIKKQQAMGNALDANQMEAVTKAKEAISGLWAAFDGLWNKIVVAAAPVLEMVGNGIKRAMEGLQPVFDFIAGYVDGLFFAWGVVLEELAADVGNLVRWLVELTGVTMNWGNIAHRAGHLAIDVAGAGAVAWAALWDVMKAGAGAIAYVNSFVIDGFKGIVNALKETLSLFKQLPESVRPTWLDSMIESVDNYEKKVGEAADSSRRWGMGQTKGFGDGIARTEKWVDELHKRLDAKNAKRAKETAQAILTPLAIEPTKFSSAILSGSQESYKLQMQNTFKGLTDPGSINKQQLDESKKQTTILKQLVKAQKTEPEEVI